MTLTNGTSTTTATSAPANANGAPEVWSSLLQSVASSRLVPCKDIIILGDSHSGKSTLIKQLQVAISLPAGQNTAANGIDTSTSTSSGVNGTGANGTAVGAGGSNGSINAGAGSNGTLNAQGGQNAENGSAPVMVEMGTGTSEDHLFSGGVKKNDLALSYSFWNVEDDENEDTIARLGLYQVAGSQKSYNDLLKYCLNSNTVAESVVLIVLDWSRPWTFMENMQRWIKVLEGAIDRICKEGAVAGGHSTWTKGKALVDELCEKLSRYIQEYSEPPAAGQLNGISSSGTTNGTMTNFSESLIHHVGSLTSSSHGGLGDNVLLPLAEGCLSTNTGIPIVFVCTKSDQINQLEREMDYQEETFDYIQQSIRTICLKYGASLFYTSIHQPHTFANLRQYLLHRLLTPSTLNNSATGHQAGNGEANGNGSITTNSSAGIAAAAAAATATAVVPASFPFKLRAQVVERDQVMVPAGWDSVGKIKVLRSGFDCTGLADGWDIDMTSLALPTSIGTPGDGLPIPAGGGSLSTGSAATGASAITNGKGELIQGARQVYEEVVVNPSFNHAPVTVQPLVAAEDDQVFLERFFETLQRANERSGINNGGSAMQQATALGGGGALGGPSYAQQQQQQQQQQPQPHSPAIGGPMSPIAGNMGGHGGGADAEDVASRLKRLTNNSGAGKSVGGNHFGPALQGAGSSGNNMVSGSGGLPGSGGSGTPNGASGPGGLSSANMRMMMMMTNKNEGSSAGSSTSTLGGGSAAMVNTGSGGGGMVSGGSGSTSPGYTRASSTVPGGNPTQNEAISQFFQSLMTRKGTSMVVPPSVGGGSSGSGSGSPAPGSGSAPSE